jgi:hypothetical protein
MIKRDLKLGWSFIRLNLMFIFCIQSPAYNQPSNLRCSSPDFIQLGITKESSSWIVIYVTVSTQDLRGIIRKFSSFL